MKLKSFNYLVGLLIIFLNSPILCEEKPVGTVYIAIATEEENWVSKFQFPGNRKQVRELTAQSGLDLVRKYLLRLKDQYLPPV